MFIRRLTIERYRGLEHLEWDPPARVNCLIGPGDVGKSTILAAIERLLDPTGSPVASEFDYYARRVEQGFEVTAVLGDLDEEFLASLRNPPLQGWLGGELKPLPDEGGAEPVIVARVNGSPDLDVTHVLVTPGEAEDIPFSQGIRRRLLLSRITTGGRAASELRLGRGTLLDRHVGGSEFQGQLRSAAAAVLADLKLPEQADRAVMRLRNLFREAGLPENLSLGLITPQGWSLLGLLGLVEGTDAGEAIPLAFAGAGTKQLAMFRLAAGLMGASPIVLMDEPEAGLEPYRQRRLITEIREAVGERGQAFLTTHSPAILEALETGEISRLAADTSPVSLAREHVSRIRRDAPDALLSRLPVLCEGETEAGLLQPVLDAMAHEDGLGSLDAMGVRLVARWGQPQILDEADSLLKTGISIGLFVDNEASYSGRRSVLASNEACAFGTWPTVRNVEEAVSMWLPWEHLATLVKLAAGERNEKVLLQQVGHAIGSPGWATLDELRQSHTEQQVREALAKAMQSKSNPWFKTEAAARGLGIRLLQIGLPREMNDALSGFWLRLREIGRWVPMR